MIAGRKHFFYFISCAIKIIVVSLIGRFGDGKNNYRVESEELKIESF
jgi:hypothetical protein